MVQNRLAPDASCGLLGNTGVSLDITAACGLTKPSEVRHEDVCATSAWVSEGSLRLKGHWHWGFSDTSADAFWKDV